MAPDELADALAWLARNTKEVKELAEPALNRRILTAETGRLDGTEPPHVRGP